MPLALAGLKAWVSCEGEALPEYQVKVENERLITCYVPSEVGKTFVVHYASDGYNGDTYTRIFVDGVEADGGCVRSSQLQKGTSTFRGIQRDRSLRPFVFASVETSDHDDSPARDLSQLEQVRGILRTGHPKKKKAKPGRKPEKNDKKRAESPSKGADRNTKRQRAAETRPPPNRTQVKEEAAETAEGSNLGQNSSSDADRIQLLEQALKSSQDALANIQAELQNLKSKHAGPSAASKVERPSPIRLGPHNGEVIDLIED
ncbi:hypothetical protein EWM64_g5099 [Hericium alpestre]|uniref:DUF7918 domain-containing protein n=1 Tax=Hericium alpestre TaxID=135208 RepID=A0A4Y9ZZN6_9AGAM|nr:hypothetical protein EWM64_g5099 [Hericium alpestre]